MGLEELQAEGNVFRRQAALLEGCGIAAEVHCGDFMALVTVLDQVPCGAGGSDEVAEGFVQGFNEAREG